MFQFFVRAHDSGTPTMHKDVSVNIFIMSNSDEAPIFEQQEKRLFLSEYSAPGTIIAKIRLTTNITVKFKVVSESQDDPQFTINEVGELRLAKTLDRETKDHHTIVIMAETDASPILTATTEIELHVRDENDNIPIFESNIFGLEGKILNFTLIVAS